MEGTIFPDFDVTDLKGESYNNSFLQGKTTIIKTWFIACKPCVAEFPELNELTESYKDDNAVKFLSLAIDTKPLLQKFLVEKPFNYAVVAEQKNFIEKQLSLHTYPTHLVIDEEGKILKVFNRASRLISFLQDYKPNNTNRNAKLAPPPPPPPPPPPSKT